MSLPLSYYEKYLSGAISKNDLVVRGCLQPKELTIVDSASSEYRNIIVDCGTCYNCRKDRRDQWVSRMCLHSLYWEYCYYVTLTYAPFDMTLYDKHPFLSDWLDTRPSLDSWNSLHRKAWTPSILCRSHVQKFLKRLRFNTGAVISYVYCGEYGEDYGRPHFHLIVWSHSPLSYSDFRQAWSYKCVRTSNPRVVAPWRGHDDSAFSFLIGDVRVDDLVSNGTLDWDAKAPVSDDRHGKFCFSYVAKYVGKLHSCYENKYAYMRIKRAWAMSPFNDSSFDEDTLEYFSTKHSKNISLNSTLYENISFSDFVSLVDPFFGASTLNSIGKQYALENLSRFAAANYSLPKFQGKVLVFPNYYRFLLSKTRQPLRLEKVVLSGVSLAKGRYKDLLQYFMAMANSRDFIFDLVFSSRAKWSDCHTDGRPVTDFTHSDLNGSVLEFCFLRENGSPYHYRYDVSSDVFLGYVFNRHSRDFEFSEYVDRVDMCSYICRVLRKEINDFEVRKHSLFASYDFDREIKSDLIDGVCDSDSFTLVQDYLERVRIWNARYKSLHVSDSR